MLSPEDKKRLIAANINLLLLQCGSCSCMTKTQDHDYHHKDCRYRLAKETSALICSVLKNTENKNDN